MKKVTLQAIRIDEQTKQNMIKALDLYNKKSLVEISQADFRRLAIELLSQMILNHQEIPLKLIK